MKQRSATNQDIPLSERPTLTVDEFCGMVGIGRSTFYKVRSVDGLDKRPRHQRGLLSYFRRDFSAQAEKKSFSRRRADCRPKTCQSGDLLRSRS
jgi:hypothetical protein